MSNGNAQALGTALAGGAIAASLIETLHDKGILTLDESRAVLDRAMKSLAPVMQAEGGMQASRIIGGMMTGKFSARR
jgi:polyhydroxyalkanoate synthesis regulator phasin